MTYKYHALEMSTQVLFYGGLGYSCALLAGLVVNLVSSGPLRFILCKDNTSKDTFSQCENLYKEFAYRSKIEQMGTATTIELTTRSTERNPTMCEVT